MQDSEQNAPEIGSQLQLKLPIRPRTSISITAVTVTDLPSAAADGARRSRFLLLSFFFVISRLLLTPAPEVQPLPTQFCCFRGWPQLRGSNHVLYFLNLSGFTMNNPKRNKTLNQDLFQNKGTKKNQDQDDIANGTIV